jgi:hypothetical protein
MEAPQPLGFYVVAFVLPMLATIPVTAIICHYRAAEKMRISYGTFLGGACFIPLLLFLFFFAGCCLGDGKAIPSALVLLQVAGLVACACALPALVVVTIYQRRSKGDEK